MTQSLFSVLCAIFMLFSSVFGCSQGGILPTGLPNEKEPSTVEGTVYTRVDGVQNSVFYIAEPDIAQCNTVSASSFGISENSEDNYDAFREALAYCRKNPGTKLVFEKGDYYFRTAKNIPVENIKNTVIDGNGSRFIFSHGNYFAIHNCSCVEFTGFSVDWNDENGRLASLVRVANADKNSHTVELKFIDGGKASEDTVFGALTQYDHDTLTPGVRGGTKEKYIYSEPEIIVSTKVLSPDTLSVTHNGALDNLKNGEVYLLRHSVYGGNVFNVSRSSNITFSDINIFTADGMGWLITDRCERFQLLNCTVGLSPDKNAERISTTADAVHIANTNGYFRIDGCDFGFMGDDAVNVHDNLSFVTEITSSNSAKLYSNAPNFTTGDTALFFNSSFKKLDFTAVVVSFDGETAVFDRALPSSVVSGCIAANGSIDSGNYVITNNRFHENRARALLLQSSFGLCENNEFYKIMGNPIKIISDLSTGRWLEGTGVDLLEVKNNTFTDCNISDWGALIEISSNIDGKASSEIMFRNIFITGNTFDGGMGEQLSASSVSNLVFTGNTVTNAAGKIILGKKCKAVTVKDNAAPDSPLGFTVKLRSLSALTR